DPAQIAAAADKILAAERPVIIAGNGVRIAQAYDKLRALAEAAGLPVATTAAGKGTFPETHPLALGVFGTFGTPAANACIGEAGRREAAARRVAQHREKQGYFNAPEYRSDDKPILPQRVIGELMRNLPEGGIVTCDAGENRILMTHFYQTKAAGGFLQAAGSGPMGFGIPAALGAKLVHPDRPVVACVGDCGFATTVNGLMTAIEPDIPIACLV